MTDNNDDRSWFWIPFSLSVYVLLVRYLPLDPPPRKEFDDITGTIITVHEKYPWGPRLAVCFLVLAALSFVITVIWDWWKGK